MTETSAIAQSQTFPNSRDIGNSSRSKISISGKACDGDRNDTSSHNFSTDDSELTEFNFMLSHFSASVIGSSQHQSGYRSETKNQNFRVQQTRTPSQHRGIELRERVKSRLTSCSSPDVPGHQLSRTDDPATEQDRRTLNAIQVLRHENFHSIGTTSLYRHQPQLLRSVSEFIPQDCLRLELTAATDGDATSASTVKPFATNSGGEMNLCVCPQEHQGSPERFSSMPLFGTQLSNRADAGLQPEGVRLLPQTDEALDISRYRGHSLRILEVAVAPDNLAEFKIRFALTAGALEVAISSSNNDLLSVLQQDRCAIEEQIKSSGIANVEVCVVQSGASNGSFADTGLNEEHAPPGTDYTSAASQHSEQHTRHRRHSEMVQTMTPSQSHKVRTGQGLSRSGVFV